MTPLTLLALIILGNLIARALYDAYSIRCKALWLRTKNETFNFWNRKSKYF